MSETDYLIIILCLLWVLLCNLIVTVTEFQKHFFGGVYPEVSKGAMQSEAGAYSSCNSFAAVDHWYCTIMYDPLQSAATENIIIYSSAVLRIYGLYGLLGVSIIPALAVVSTIMTLELCASNTVDLLF